MKNRRRFLQRENNYKLYLVIELYARVGIVFEPFEFLKFTIFVRFFSFLNSLRVFQYTAHVCIGYRSVRWIIIGEPDRGATDAKW